MYKAIIVVLATLATCNAASLASLPQSYLPPPPAYVEPPARPSPYDFGYDTTDAYGTRLTRQERGDGAGVVTGSYSYREANGLQRTVNYVADANGFRATVTTNEPGTETSNPADVVITSNPISVPVVSAPRRLTSY